MGPPLDRMNLGYPVIELPRFSEASQIEQTLLILSQCSQLEPKLYDRFFGTVSCGDAMAPYGTCSLSLKRVIKPICLDGYAPEGLWLKGIDRNRGSTQVHCELPGWAWHALPSDGTHIWDFLPLPAPAAICLCREVSSW